MYRFEHWNIIFSTTAQNSAEMAYPTNILQFLSLFYFIFGTTRYATFQKGGCNQLRHNVRDDRWWHDSNSRPSALKAVSMTVWAPRITC